MVSLYAKIHISNISNEYIPLLEIDFKQNVAYLKARISSKVQHASSFDIFYNGLALEDEQILSGLVRPQSIVHCFEKHKAVQSDKLIVDGDTENARAKVQELFTVISNIQISVTSRANVLHKVLAEYPEFRRNMGAQALIRDSVLFGTLDQPEVIRNISIHYPIICKAAGFIVDTIKKELTLTELATDSTNSSEDDFSIAPSTSGTNQNADRLRRLFGVDNNNQMSSETQHPSRTISRQQLQAALEQISSGSANSLANISQQNVSAANNSIPTSASGDRISEELFRHELQRALNVITQEFRGPFAENADSTITPTQDMDTDTDVPQVIENTNAPINNTNNIEIPSQYRNHEYADQLRTMLQMGFIDCDENINFLNMSEGNVEIAINLLMGSMT